MKVENPYIAPFNHFTGYQESINKLKEQPGAVEYERLCHELFHLNPSGIRYIELVHERYLTPALFEINHPNFTMLNVWGEGYKQAFRDIITAVKTHNQRKTLETNV
jgi:hypothetical protein